MPKSHEAPRRRRFSPLQIGGIAVTTSLAFGAGLAIVLWPDHKNTGITITVADDRNVSVYSTSLNPDGSPRYPAISQVTGKVAMRALCREEVPSPDTDAGPGVVTTYVLVEDLRNSPIGLGTAENGGGGLVVATLGATSSFTPDSDNGIGNLGPCGFTQGQEGIKIFPFHSATNTSAPPTGLPVVG